MRYLHDCIATGYHPNGDAWTKKIGVKKDADRPTFWAGNYNFFIIYNDLNIEELFSECVDKKKITGKSANTNRVSGPMTDELIKKFTEKKEIKQLLSSSNYKFSTPYITHHTENGYINFDFSFIRKNELNPDKPYANLKLNIHLGKIDGKKHTDSIVLNQYDNFFDHCIEKIEWFVNCLKDGTVKRELDKIENVCCYKNKEEIIDYRFSVKSVTELDNESEPLEKPPTPDIDTWGELEEEGKESYGSKTNANSFRSNDDDGEISPLSSSVVKEPPDTWEKLYSDDEPVDSNNDEDEQQGEIESGFRGSINRIFG